MLMVTEFSRSLRKLFHDNAVRWFPDIVGLPYAALGAEDLKP
jgi:hypothetical protein